VRDERPWPDTASGIGGPGSMSAARRLLCAGAAAAAFVTATAAGTVALAPAAPVTAAPVPSGSHDPAAQAGSPGADPSSVQASYSCAVPVLGATTFAATVTGTAPSSVGAGQPVEVQGYQVSLLAPSSLVDDILALGGKSPLVGTVTVADVSATGATPGTINAASTPLGFSAALASGQAATIAPAPVPVGPFRAGASGTIDFTPGAVTITGQFPVIGQATIPCTLQTSPAPVFASTAILLSSAPLAVTTTSLPGGTAGLTYTATLAATGGTPPYSWSVAAGSTLPAGLALDASTGVISGIPSSQGTTSFTVVVTDSASPPAKATSGVLSITVAPPVPIPTVFGWGQNGELGNTSTTESPVPVPVAIPPGNKVTEVSAGADFSLALTSVGAVYAWGDNEDGQLGDGTTTTSTTPTPVSLPPGVTVTAISAGGFHSLALTSTGAVYAWGANFYGQLGNGTVASSAVPVPVTLPAGVTIKFVAAGGSHSLAVTSSGQVYSWGRNASGQLGDGSFADSDLPVQVQMPAGAEAASAAAGAAHSLAVTSDGAVYAWGFGSSGQLGNGSRAESDLPVKVRLPNGAGATQASAGAAHSLAVTSDGRVYAWGYDAQGQVGTGGERTALVPARVRLPSAVTAVAAGQYHSLAVTFGGSVYAWGANAYGQLGDRGSRDRSSPVRSDVQRSTATAAVGSGPLAKASLALAFARR
jgi:alpha-tubulin suppressor-like RCC1 family protein